MSFVHLHVHSHYSLLDGLGKIHDLVAKAKEFGLPAMALTDHGSMYGAIEFYLACRNQGLKPIIGLEAYITDDVKKPPSGSAERAYNHLTLLAKNLEGYQNLMKLTSLGHLEGFYFRPRIDHSMLKENKGGIIVLSGCLRGELPQALLSGNLNQAKKIINFYKEIFGQDYYLEVQSHSHLPDQEKVNQALYELSEELHVPLVATSDTHYVNKEDVEAHDILLCIQTNSRIDDPKRFTMSHEFFHLYSPEEMKLYFKNYPQAIDNTLKIAEAVDLAIPLGKIIFPKFEIPQGENMQNYLRHEVYEGAKKRGLEISGEVKERLDYELSVIEKMKYEVYFLVVADYVNWAKEQGIMVGPGRGSGAGSLVSYALNITSVNPLEHHLLFERFLNPERIDLPDLDVDFADDRRDEVVHYVEEKYGHMNVAQIATFGTMASRAVVRDVGRALGMSYTDVDKVAKLVPPPIQGKHVPLKDGIKEVPELKAMYEQDAKVKHLFDLAMRLEGTARHISTHAAGVVIADQPLYNYTPIQYAPKGEKILITQYSMKPLEKVGLIKMDFLGLSNLTTIKNALRIIRKTKEIKIDIDEIPFDDAKTYQMLSRGETVGVFQLEGDGMTRYLKELRPSRFGDIVAMVALYRPGPLQFIPDFIDRKRGRKPITYLHPRLKPILEETYGIAVYQEQVLQIARDLCGFTFGEADILRKAIGKKIRELMSEQKKKFIDGAIKNGFSRETAERLFDFVEPFASYGFNRAHSASYATISYWTAYLKANFPNEFMAALLTSSQNDLDRTARHIAATEAMGIKVLPPSVNESFTDFAVVKETGNIRFGLNAIKNVGRKVSDLIVEERKANNAFSDLSDFLNRVPKEALNRKVLESLIKAGALDDFGERGRLLAALDYMVETVSRVQPNVSFDQLAIFAEVPKSASRRVFALPAAEPVSDQVKLTWEKELLGTYVSRHPFKEIAASLKDRVMPVNKIESGIDGQMIKVAGIITRAQMVRTKNGEPMCFVMLEDMTGSLEVIVFPKILQGNANLWLKDKMLLVEGRVNVKDLVQEEGEIMRIVPQAKIVASKAYELTDDFLQQFIASSPSLYIQKQNNHFLIELPRDITGERLNDLKEALKRYPGDVPVSLVVWAGEEKKQIATSTTVNPSPELTEEIKQLIEGKIPA